MQKRKYLKVISFLNQHNRHLELELTKEKRRRAEELSKIIKSLLCFEAKLKHDKKVINQKLYERDTEISRLRVLNRVLRKKYAEAAALAENGDDIDNSIIYGDLEEGDFGAAQNCPSCRKDFYELSGKDVWTQTFVDGRSSIGNPAFCLITNIFSRKSFCIPSHPHQWVWLSIVTSLTAFYLLSGRKYYDLTLRSLQHLLCDSAAFYYFVFFNFF